MRSRKISRSLEQLGRAVVELLVGADVEVAVVRELSSVFEARGVLAHVGTRIPVSDPKPPAFVRVLAVGGASRDLVTDSPSVAVECFAVDEGDAERLAARARAVLEAAGRSGLMGAEVCYLAQSWSLPQNLPKLSVPTHHRFTFTMSMDLRKRVW